MKAIPDNFVHLGVPMKEITGEDLFDQIDKTDAICITTNCSVMEDGTNPMGGGSAGAAARRWNEIEAIYGQCLMMAPNVPVILGYIKKDDVTNFTSIFDDRTGITSRTHTSLIAYPTMMEVTRRADFNLVKRSAMLLEEMANLFHWDSVHLVSPGTGIGGLDVKDVHNMLKDELDDRFTVMLKDFTSPALIVDATDEIEDISTFDNWMKA